MPPITHFAICGTTIYALSHPRIDRDGYWGQYKLVVSDGRPASTQFSGWVREGLFPASTHIVVAV